MTLSIVQTTPIYQSGSLNSPTATFSSNVTAGNAIVFFFGNTAAPAIGYQPPTTNPNDGLSNSYSLIRGDTGSGDFGDSQWLSVWWANNISGGACAVSVVVPTTSQPIIWAFAAEVTSSLGAGEVA